MEMEWSVEVPDDAVATLRDRFGTGNRIAVAVDVSALLVKRLTLPALSPEQRRQIVALDPERYFPVRDANLVVGVRDDDLVVAAHAQQFDRLVDALSTLGVVESVEPAPMALARHLASVGMAGGALVVADPHDRDAAVALLEAGCVANLRKVPATSSDISDALQGIDAAAAPAFLFPWQDQLAAAIAETSGVECQTVPAPPGTTDSFAAAMGAWLGLTSPPELALISKRLQRRMAVRGWRRAALAGSALLLALALCLWSIDYRRERSLMLIERRVADQQDEASQVQTLLADVAAAEAEVSTLAAVARNRHDPLEVLLLVNRLLPQNSYLRSLHVAAHEWELDGYARDAARLIPTLEESEVLADVRFRTATTRVQLNNEAYESFSLALRYVPPSQ
jgi:Tfp pilus assembly protein PilN